MQKKIQLSLVLVALSGSLYANNTIELEPITVTSATKTKQSIDDITSNVNVITSAEIEEKHYTTVTEALSSISGISFTSNGGLGKAASVNVRGFDSKRVLVLIDGVKYNDHTGTTGAKFEHLMIDDVEQIEIIKGAQSGIWGADATAGVINIITKTAREGLHGSINGEYGSFNTKKYGASASYKEEDYYLKASLQRVNTNGFSAQAPKGVDLDSLEDDGYNNVTTSLKAGFNINETNKIDITHTIIKSESETDKGFYSSNTLQVKIDKANDTRYSLKRKDTFSKINFNHTDSFNEVDIYAMQSDFDRDYIAPSPTYSNGKATEYGLKSNIPYNEKDFVTVGAEYKTIEHTNDINKKYNSTALFLTNSNIFDLGGKTILTESLRKDDYDKFDGKLTGKIGIKHFFKNVDGLTGSANYGTAYNVPTPYNLYSTYGNANLKPENTKSVDLSIGYKKLKLTYFDSKIKDMIEYDSGVSKYNNIFGTSRFKGFEVEYSQNFTDDVYLTANYTRLSAKNNDGEVLRRRPKNSVKFSADYYGINDLHIGINGEYIGSRYDSDNQQGEQTGRYTVFNAVANYDITKNLSAYVKIDNLFDKYYQVIDGYATAPRSAYAGFKAKF